MQQSVKGRSRASTWSVYQTMFIDNLEAANAARRTIDTYGLAVTQLGEFLIEQGMPTDPTKVTREHLTEWMRYLQRAEDQGGRGVEAATANQRYRSVSRFFRFLIDTDEIAVSPMAKMMPPKIPEKLVPVVRADDLKKLLKTVSADDFESRRDKAIISLFIDCGMRVSEMANLDLDDVDLEHRDIMIRKAKGGTARRIGFTRETRTDLNRYLLVRGKQIDRREREGAHDLDEDALWLGKRGRLTKSGTYRLIVRRCDEAGIGHVWPHMLRHTVAHQYRLAGGSEDNLMRVMGWKSREMLHRYGASAGEERAIEAHDAVSLRHRL